MAKRAAIPQDNREYPDYEYREYPKWVGRDEFGQDLIANTAEDVAGLEERKVYPMVLGLDNRGRRVEAMHPDEVVIRKTWVTRPIDKVAEAAGENKLTSAVAENKALENENARLRAQLEAMRTAQATSPEVETTSTGKGSKKKVA